MPLSNLSLSPGATFNNLLARNCEGVEREREGAIPRAGTHTWRGRRTVFARAETEPHISEYE